MLKIKYEYLTMKLWLFELSTCQSYFTMFDFVNVMHPACSGRIKLALKHWKNKVGCGPCGFSI